MESGHSAGAEGGGSGEDFVPRERGFVVVTRELRGGFVGCVRESL